MLDILIKNGQVVDGSGKEPFKAHVGIEADKIAVITADELPARQVIDAKGLMVAPGFIDGHTHAEGGFLADPGLEPAIRQGIATVIVGQCGISVAPIVDSHTFRTKLASFVGEKAAAGFPDVREFFHYLGQHPVAVNVAYLVPHGNLRALVVGEGNKTATDQERTQMCELLTREMVEGALGLSTGLGYPPCIYSDDRELIDLAKTVAKHGGTFHVHQWSEGDYILESLRLVIDIARKTGVATVISHLKVAGRHNKEKLAQVIALIDQAREEGLPIWFDQYPYPAGSTVLSLIVPPWVQAGGIPQFLARLTDPHIRHRLKQEMETGLPGWDNIVQMAGWEGITITGVQSVKNQEVVGKNLQQLAKMRGVNHPADAVFDLLIEEQNQVMMVDYLTDEESITALMRHSAQHFGTDSLYVGLPHPRTFGTYPRILGHYIRKSGVLSLAEGVAKMTRRPAERLNLHGRGGIVPGYYADLVIFNPETVGETGTYEHPSRHPTGITYVLVNGQIVFRQGKMEYTRAGRVLKGNGCSRK